MIVEHHGAGGIGLATVKVFLKSNALGLVLVDLSQTSLQKVVCSLSLDDRKRCEVVTADVGSHAEFERDGELPYVQRAAERWGHLDVSVLNAGICEPPRSIMDTEVRAWERMMRVNGLGGMTNSLHLNIEDVTRP